ncbi:phage tail sheath C-terminal domain-containing protein [Novosphingobium resinovorum]
MPAPTPSAACGRPRRNRCAAARGARARLQAVRFRERAAQPAGPQLHPRAAGLRHALVGTRTRVGSDVEASQWKYVPVRRLALMIEESLFRGTQWVVFEPNDEPLWAQIRLNLTTYMHGLFRQGAFQGQTPRDAYLVKCDKETTTQADIDRGIVNILVGFAPLKPAEFVMIRIQQLAGQAAS